MVPELASSTMRRSLRLASGLVLFTYITAHLVNHALGLVSLHFAEEGLVTSAEYWSSEYGTILLYSAFSLHFFLAGDDPLERFLLPERDAIEKAQRTCG